MTKKYITAAGDMWDSIAKTQLGSEFYANQLIEVNQKYANCITFDYGIELTLPDIVNVQAAVDLLPWVT